MGSPVPKITFFGPADLLISATSQVLGSKYDTLMGRFLL